MKKLGNLLAEIADAKITKDERKKIELEVEFMARIENHKEKKMLIEALASALAGRKYISFGRNILPPESLNQEGFELRDDGCMFDYYFG